MQRDEKPARRILHALARLACFGAALAAVLAGGLSWLRDARLGRPTLVFDFSRKLEKQLPELAAAERRGETTVAVLGASALVSYPEGRRVPDRLQERLPARVVSLGMPGSGPFDYYFLADEVAAARPDVVVIAVNLDHFSQAWRNAYSRPQLAGWIHPERLPEAFALPLERTGLTADRLLFYVSVVRAGFYDAWYWLALRQAQLGRARAQLEAWLQGGVYEPRNDTGDDTPERSFRRAASQHTIARVFDSPDLRHYREPALREHYGAVLAGLPPDDPVLEVLDATVERLVEAGARVLVYVEPIETETLRRAGLLDEAGLSRSLEALAAQMRARGAVFVDLHDALPSDAFRDAPGHLAFEQGVDGPARLADELAPHVRALLRSRGAR